MSQWEITSFQSDDESDRDRSRKDNEYTTQHQNEAAVHRTHGKHNGKSNRLPSFFASQNVTLGDRQKTSIENPEANRPQDHGVFPKKTTKLPPAKSSNHQYAKDSHFTEMDLVGRKTVEITTSSNFQNPAFISPSWDESQVVPEFQSSHGKRSYQAPIYSVNSAGRSVPITIEESEDEIETGDDISMVNAQYQEGSRPIESETPPVPSASSAFPRYASCCISSYRKYVSNISLTTIWRKSYLPNSTVICVWLCVVTSAFLYNLWSIPLRATFLSEIQTPWEAAWFSFDAICDLIYVVDIFMTFRTSYIKSGVFVTDVTLLNRYHCRHWTLILDICAIIPTDFLFLHSMNPYFRLNRLLKVHRVLKFYQIGELYTWSPNLWRSLALLHLFFVCIHYHACIYFSLSSANGFGALLTSWSYPNPEFFPDYQPLYRRYTYSFYWCLVVIGSINDRFFPETDWQLLFSIYVRLLGLTFAVIFVGFFTVMIWDHASHKLEFEKTMRNTRDYLKLRNLPKDLRARVMRYYQYSWLSEQFPYLDDGNVLRTLPVTVRHEVEYHSKYNILKQISSLATCEDDVMVDLVAKLERTIYLPGQFVCKSGALVNEIYIVGEGILQVVTDADPDVSTLRAGDVFGEIDILRESEIRRTANVISYGYSVVYILYCEDIRETFKKHPKFPVRHPDKGPRNTIIAGQECKSVAAKCRSHLTCSAKSQDSKAFSSKFNFQAVNRYRGNSPDSGMLSTPSVGMPWEGESPITLCRERVKFEVTEKVAGLYQDHIRNLKASLDSIWYQELEYLQQRLEDTERERDMKAAEVSRLRRQMAQDIGMSKLTENLPEAM